MIRTAVRFAHPAKLTLHIEKELEMRLLLNTVLTCAVVVVLAANLSAAEEKKAGKHKERSQQDIIAKILATEGMNLTAEQKTKLDALKTEYAPKIQATREKVYSVITEEQYKARDDARRAARAARKSQAETKQAVDAAVTLTDEQKTKLAEAEKASMEVRDELRGKVETVLTPEQKELLKNSFGRRANGKKAK
jgi:Spy/CpxP family protein refolding chaperone